MNLKNGSIFLGVYFWAMCGVVAAQGGPPVSDKTIFEEKDGMLAVEAEHFFSQSSGDIRKFYLTAKGRTPEVSPDGDPSHVGGASNGAYIEILPDTRRSHDDKLVRGGNFSEVPGKLAVVSYKVHVSNPGRYYVWVRAYSTGSEDNGLHVGLDGKWPASGRKMQWCEGRHTWRWESKQRTKKEHCGVPYGIYLDIEKAGEHVVHFSMREDGFEFDKWLMTLNRDFVRPAGVGPASVVKAGPAPRVFPMVPASPGSKVKPEKTPARGSKNSKVSAQTPVRRIGEKPAALPRKPDGDGSVNVSDELKTWHKVTLDLSGPYAHERDDAVNPFTDHQMLIHFRHADGTEYRIPGFFAADGNAGNWSAQDGHVWRARFAPDRAGLWSYVVKFDFPT